MSTREQLGEVSAIRQAEMPARRPTESIIHTNVCGRYCLCAGSAGYGSGY